MMFIDASAIIAILNREAGYEKLAECIEQATDGVKFSPIVRFEAVLGLARARSRGASARPMRNGSPQRVRPSSSSSSKSPRRNLSSPPKSANSRSKRA